MKNSIGIDKNAASDLIAKLNKLLANYQLYYQNLRGFHWNVTGNSFFELHIKFEELYTVTNVSIDEIAERILTLEGQPLHTFSDYLKEADIKEVNDLTGGKEMVKNVLENTSSLIMLEREILKSAADADDEGTVSMISDYIKAQEKDAWMLRAYLA